jgi:hypothetical protein
MAVDPEKVELRLNWEQQPEIMGGAFSEPDQ